MFSCDGSYCLELPRQTNDAMPTRQKLAMQCEDFVPLDAEQMEVDFQASPSGLTIVAIESVPMVSLVNSLEQAGLRLVEITPTLPTLVQSLQRAGQLDPDGVVLLSSLSGMHTELTRWHSGKLVSWSRMITESPQQQLGIDASAESPVPGIPVTHITAPEVDHQPLDDNPDSTSLRLGSLHRALMSAAEDLVSDRLTDVFRLRRGQLAWHDPLRSVRRDLNRLFTAAAILWLTLCVGLLWKTWLANRTTRFADQQLVASFQETFPGQRVPSVIVRQFQNERSRLLKSGMASRATSASASTVKQATDAREVLIPLVAAFPTNQTFEVESLRINDGQFVLDLSIENHEAAVAIVDALRAAGLDTQSPTSERVAERKVTSRIRGRVRDES